MKPKTDRNAEILKDYQNKMSLVNLVKKYSITPARLYFIVKREKAKQTNS